MDKNREYLVFYMFQKDNDVYGYSSTFVKIKGGLTKSSIMELAENLTASNNCKFVVISNIIELEDEDDLHSSND